MAITGKAAPRSVDIVDRVAEMVGCEPAVIDAILQVETNGDPYDDRGRLIIRPETAKIAKCPYIKPDQLKTALKTFGKQPNTADQDALWLWFDHFTAQYGVEAACWITSFGSPQIMGFNFQICKYDSPYAMAAAFADSEDEQLMAMGRFLISSGLRDACRQRKWSVIARLYNGKDYARNRYDVKLADAYEHSEHTKGTNFTWPEDDILELGSHGEAVKALQLKLAGLGFHVHADGDFGPETRDAVRSLQFRFGLAVDGKVGSDTARVLATAPAKELPSTPVGQVIAQSSTAKSSLAQIGIGATSVAVAAANAIGGASAPVPAPVPIAPVSLVDVDATLKSAEQGIGIVQKILAIGVDKLLIALGVGAIVFGAIALTRRIQAHYARKIG